MISLSVVIITFNEEKNIGRCLESVKHIADEIVVVDSCSNDKTKDICRQFNVRFIEHVFEGHIGQKNFALTQSTFHHVLSLDADECLSGTLQHSIGEVKKNWQNDGYYVNRLSNFCGTWMHHSGWYPDRKLRIFDKRKGQWGGINPHDKFEMIAGAETGFLSGDLLHYTADSEKEFAAKMDRYAAIAAEELAKRNRKTNIVSIYLKTGFTFLRNYFFRAGFLDGKAGWRVSAISAHYTFQKYSALRRLREK
jgi:glycosyltransferase involved in cell wall biosynthesis